MLNRIFPFFLLFLLIGCHQNKPSGGQMQSADQTISWQPPAAGTAVAQYKERVTDDNLNEKYFKVTVKATENSRAGEFQLKLEYGFNINETMIQLPEWTGGVILKPLLRKGAGQYHCLLGFDAGDGQFRELYEINAENGDLRLKQTKGYFKTPQ